MQQISHTGMTIFQTAPEPDALLLYICSEERQEISPLLSGLSRPCALLPFPVEDWNRDLSPWPSEAVFGDEAFSGGGRATLSGLETLLASLPASLRPLPVYLCGYSLGGLFSLWAMHESTFFSGCAAVSGSFWFPGLLDFVRSAPLSPVAKIYLSLGKKESKSRNRQMRTVGETLNELAVYYAEHCVSTLEWNEGNHFTDPQGRMLKGMNWLLSQ